MDIADFVTMRTNDAFRDAREDVPIYPVESVRPAWYEASCRRCEWETSGSEPVCEQARDEHISRCHNAGRMTSAVYAIVEDYRIVMASIVIDAATGQPDAAMVAARGLIAKSLRMVLARFAALHADHPDFNPAWRTGG